MTSAEATNSLKTDGIEVLPDPPKPTIKEPNPSDVRLGAVASIIAMVAVAAGYLILLRGSDNYDVIQAVQFAGSPERLQSANLTVSLGDARSALWGAVAYSVLWGLVGWLLLHFVWDRAWKAGVGTKMKGATLGLVLGVGGGLLGIIEKVLSIATIRSSGTSIQFVDSWQDAVPKAIVTLAWVKWLLAGTMILLVVAMAVSSLTAAFRRDLPDKDEDIPDELPGHDCFDEPAGVGICCSGGGIRAAGFALGALSRLEQEPNGATTQGKLGILGRADYLASVSGGGYAAAAWRIAAGPGELPSKPIIGDPTDFEAWKDVREYPEPDAPAATLLQHIRERRRYLANGPGGMLTSVLVVLRNMAFHFSLLVLSVIVLAWPLGRAIVSFAITDDGVASTRMTDGLTTDIGVHQWFPPAVAAVIAVPLLLWRLTLDRKPVRKIVDRAIKASLGVAVALALLLIALPFAVDWVTQRLPRGGGRLAVGGVYGVVLTAIWQLTKTRLKASARYLGGVVLFAGLAIFGLLVMAHAADTDEWFSSPAAWLIAFAGLAIAFIAFNPDRWSLHGFYRKRLAGTFSTKEVPRKTPKGPDTGYVSHDDEPAIYKYRSDLGVEGPQPIICCAAAREGSSQTGVPVLSLTFEPSCVTVFDWDEKDGPGTQAPVRMSHAQYQRRLPGGEHGKNLHTLMGLASVSGAAVAPSLGRLSFKGTDALLAAFNARLGVWLPNPRQQTWKRKTTPRLVNMFKEIIKTFDPVDPNLYASDGGHWENLGLVELVRRRCSTIIVIDTSGDAPGTYATFKIARKLAELECGAELDLDDESWERLAVVGPGDIVGRNYGFGTVTYAPDSDGNRAEGKILYIKAAVMETSALEIQRYAANDPRFPNYSTADQWLTADEFNHLLQLGFDSIDEALTTYPEFENNILAPALSAHVAQPTA